MKDLSWDKVVPVIFYSALTLIGGYMSYTLRDLTSNVSQLNVQMGTVVVQISATAKDNEALKSQQQEQMKIIYDHEGRLRVLEKTR